MYLTDFVYVEGGKGCNSKVIEGDGCEEGVVHLFHIRQPDKAIEEGKIN